MRGTPRPLRVAILVSLVVVAAASGARAESPAPESSAAPAGSPFVMTGSYTGDGSTGRTVTGIGFQPDLVIVKSIDALGAIVRTADMPAGDAKNLSGTHPLRSGLILSLDADGFTVGSRDKVNEDGRTFHWIALRAVSGTVAVGTYTGDGSNYLEIPTAGVTPDAAVIISAGSDPAISRFGGMTAWKSYALDGSGLVKHSIGDFLPEALAVSKSAATNTAGQDYYYVAWQNAGGAVQTGTYVGDGQAGRDIAGADFNPAYVLLASAGAEPQVHRPSTLPGDVSLYFKKLASHANLVGSMWDGGFTVGSDPAVNEAGADYYWLALANPGAQADLQVANTVDKPSPAEGEIVTLVATITNAGPDLATGLQLSDVLPPGLTYVSAVADLGSYDDATGQWSVGDLAPLAGASLTLTASVDTGTSGTSLENLAWLSASGSADPDTTNNAAAVTVTVLGTVGADLAVTQAVDNPGPFEGQTVVYSLAVINLGPDATTGVQITDLLPGTLSVLGAVADQGSYNQGNGVWDVGDLAAGASANLTLTTSVHSNTSGTTIATTATVTTSDQIDPNPGNDTSTVAVVVGGVDIQVSQFVDRYAPDEGDTITYTLIAKNLGPAPASAVKISDLLPPGLAFLAAVPGQGSYEEITGTWNIGSLAASASQTLTITATVDAGTAGTTITNTSLLAGVAEAESNPTNDSASTAITVASTGSLDLQLTAAVDEAAPDIGDVVTFTATVYNAGPGAASGIAVTDVLPPEVAFSSVLTNKGSYDPGSGIWAIGDLDAGYQAVMELRATVNPVALGTTVTNTVAITAADQADFAPDNNSAAANFAVASSDLRLEMAADNGTPAIGDTVTYTLTLDNIGPFPASGIVVTDAFPAELVYLDADADQGGFDAVDGKWTVGALNPTLAVELRLRFLVPAASAGSDVNNTASISAADQADPDPANNTATVALTVDGSDLALVLTADRQVSFEGATVPLTLTAHNRGPQAATGITIGQAVPAGLTFESATPSQGTYDAVSGVWTVGDLVPSGSATLLLSVRVDAGTTGLVILNTAGVLTTTPADPDPANNAAVFSLAIWSDPQPDTNIFWAVSGPSATVLPGAADLHEILTFSLANRGSQSDTLHALTLADLTPGPGTAGERDAEWQTLTVAANLTHTAAVNPSLKTHQTSFSGGTAYFDQLGWAVPAGDTLRVTVRGGASLAARDGAALQAGIQTSDALVLSRPYSLVGTWPLVSGQILTVDGFVAAQAAVVPLASRLLAIGSQRNLALAVDLPGNGFLPDTLYSLSLEDRGTAAPGTDISRIEVWTDDGDGDFDAQQDVLLGPATYSGERWQLTGLSAAVPAGGRRFFATVDIAETGRPDRDIRLGLPAGNGAAVEMYSGNDGPIDLALENSTALGISATDRVILTAELLGGGAVAPGARDTQLLRFLLTNTYADQRTVSELAVTNTTLAPGATDAERDAVCQQVYLRLDGNDNGVLDDLDVDRLLGSGRFQDGRVVFSAVNVALAGNSASRLFVTADIGQMTAADGDNPRGEITSPADISIPQSTVVASWPLQSDANWQVDGMIAAQITGHDISVLTLGPGEGPVLALDLVVPANGYASDELVGATLVNGGTAGAGDIQTASLWADGGNGNFDAGSTGSAPDDILLGPLTVNGDTWTSNVLSRNIPAAGLRLYTSLTVANTPQDSVTVRLDLPVNGVTVSSGNDGPWDAPVSGTGTLVISTSPLRSAVVFTTASSDTGQAGTLRMSVRNAGSEPVTDIAPYLDFASGAGLLAVGAPTPPLVANLDPGAETVFTWPFVSSAPGVVVMEGNAQGLVNGSQIRRSIVTVTAAHRVHTPVPRLEIYPTFNLPFSVTRGQQGLVPLTLTLRNPGGSDVADAWLKSIRLRFPVDTGGPHAQPSDLLERVVISEGTNVYFDSQSDTLTAIGNDALLTFNQPVVVTGSEPVTLGLRLDLRLNSTVPSFMVSIENATWLTGEDAVNNSDLTIVPGTGAFPLRTGKAVIVAPATGLGVAVPAQTAVTAVRGQTDIPLLQIDLSQSQVDDSSSSIEVGRLAFVFHDSTGAPLGDMVDRLTAVSLQSATQEHFAGPPVVTSDSLVVLQLSAPLTISGTAVLHLQLVGAIAADAPLGRISTTLGPVDQIDARDGNMNNSVPVNLTTSPLGPDLRILAPATSITVTGSGVMPAQVSRGTRDLAVMNFTVANPGGTGTADAAGDSVVFSILDATRQPLDPGSRLDRLRIMQGPDLMGQVIQPVAADGIVAVPIAAGLVAPGTSAQFQVLLDVSPASPTGTMEIVLDNHGIQAVDAITRLPIAVTAGPGTTFPLSSGLATLVEPADELRIGVTSILPPLLAPNGEPCGVFALNFANPATTGSGGIEISQLTLSQGPAQSNGAGLGRLLAAIRLRRGESVLAEVAAPAATATSVTLVPDSTLVVPAAGQTQLTVEIVLRKDAPAGPLQLLLDESGVGAVPPGGSLASVRVLPISGQNFPYTSEVGQVGAASLAASYVNYPNPFAAGREPTRFAFALSRPARVNLRVMTPHGELVAVVLQDAARAVGFYQTDTWSGRNGNGVVVHNGVYLAELTVRYDDGSQARILRKVAVVR